MSKHLKRREELGFSLPEIMVGMVIGMLGILIIMQMTSLFENQRRSTSGGDDAQNSGAIALFGISRDIKQAGYGVSSPALVGRTLVTPNVTLTPLSPVSIVQGGTCSGCNINRDANTDALLIVYGSSNADAGGHLIKDTPANGYSVTGGAQTAVPQVGSGGTTFRNGDYVTPDNGQAAGAGGTDPHYLYQVSGADPSVVPINDLAYGVAHPFLKYVTASGTLPLLFNLGPTPSIILYAVNNGALWSCNFMAAGGCPATPAQGTNWTQLAGDVVSMRAECTSAAPAYGVRIVLVTRNSQPDRNVNSPMPVWGGAPINAIDLTATQVANGFAWNNYRYKTFETIVPVRNVAWGGRGISGCQ